MSASSLGQVSSAGGTSHDALADVAATPPRTAVAVLGGTGLIGSAIVRSFLDHGHGVVVLARHAPSARRATLLAGATLVLGDARDPTSLNRALDGVAHVVDALGAPHPAESARDPLAQFDAELPVLLELLERLADRGGTGLTYLSSGGAIYGDVDELPVTEDADCHPVSPYGVTKLAAERYILMAARQRAVPVRILRVANAFGATQSPVTGQGVIAALLHSAQTGAEIRLFGDGSSVRDYVDVRDVAEAVTALSSVDDQELVVNVGSGVGHRLDEVVRLVQEVSGAVIKVDRAPARATDVKAITLDVARLASLMSWRPRTLRQGIRDAWTQWCTWQGASVVTEVP